MKKNWIQRLGSYIMKSHPKEEELEVITPTTDKPSLQQLQEPLLVGDEKKEASKETEVPRIIYVNDPEANRQFKFTHNGIHTTKYSLLFFIPKNLWEQFHRIANCYFLLICILQFIPGLSPTGRFTTLLPLSFVLIVTMIKDAYEDIKRRYSDTLTNNKKALVLRDGEFVTVKWQNVRTGDIIKVENKQSFPADIILLSTSEEQGLCYVETSSLDGETNLKIRRARPETWSINSAETASKIKAVVTCEQPNKELYKFEGNIKIGNQEKVALDVEQLLLRGSSLRNTRWIIGVVVFTGHDTKLMKNQSRTPHKASRVERLTNRFIFMIFMLEIIVCLISTIGIMMWIGVFAKSTWYLQQYTDVDLHFGWILWEGFKGYWTFFILYNNLIPISLYVSMETAKVIQGFFISQDLAIYHEESDTPAIARTSSLNEELGQVQYIFSDKTGTLTCNVMQFLKCSIGGVSYGTGITEIARAAAKRTGKVLVDDRPPGLFDPKDKFQFYDKRMQDNAWVKNENAAAIEDFLRLLAVCHTVITEEDQGKIIYQASSPDEEALVIFAKHMGVEFISRSTDEVKIKVLGKEETYKLLNVLEFNSTRKRMSVIVRDPKGKLLLLCKGADSIVFPLMKPNQKHAEITQKHLEEFANDGLRTLITAKAELDEEFYKKWNVRFQEARSAFSDREAKMTAVSAEIEKDLELVGATAIEDKLQQGVPETISDLMKAGIKIWVLTGDKQETAINIGFACDLLNTNMAIIILEGKNKEEVYRSLDKCYTNATQIKEKEAVAQALALVVEGQKLGWIMENKHAKDTFLKLGTMCKAVICCRVSPAQKAEVVNLVKNGLDAVTLSIGDGANDVSMIQAAHVGIGISGMEGLQAANAADYAIGQFRFLKRLLLVHGRWSYRRISKLILYSFYKNTVLYLTQFFFVFFNAFSGTSVHDKWTISFYNVLFTFLPIMILAIFDQDVPAEIAEQFPQLYKQGHRHTFFNVGAFVGYLINSIYHSAICFFIPYYALYFGYDIGGGQTVDMYSTGVAIYTSVLLTVSFKVLLETCSHTWLVHVCLWGSVVCWYVFMLIYGSLMYIFPWKNFISDEFSAVLQEFRIFGSGQFWLLVLLTSVVAILRDFTHKAFVRMWKKNLYYALQEKKEKSIIHKDDILATYPHEEASLIPEALTKLPSFKPLSIEEVKKLFQLITGQTYQPYKGFAFSQTEGQDEFIIIQKGTDLWTKTKQKLQRPETVEIEKE